MGKKVTEKPKQIELAKQDKAENKAPLSSILSILSILLAALAIIVSIYTYNDSKKINESIRYESAIIQRTEKNRMLSFNTNIEFWDYSIAEITRDMIGSNGLSDELSNISLYIADKQIGYALQLLYQNEEKLGHDEKYYLLLACLYAREYILGDEYILGYFNSQKSVDECSLPENIDTVEEKYQIVQGILAYYTDNLANSVHHLRTALNNYSKDSAFYDVANYWLAILSIRLRSNVCDVDAFLNSFYNDNALLNVLKSSISFLFYDQTHDSYRYAPTIISIYEDNEEYIGNYVLPFMMDNPASYLDADSSEFNSQWSLWGSQKNLYSLYNMLFCYTEQLQQRKAICRIKFDEPIYKDFFESLNSFESEERFFIDPRLNEKEYSESFSLWSMIYFNSIRYNDIDLFVPTDYIFDRLVYLAAIHSTSSTDYSSYSYNKAFEYWKTVYDNCSEQSFEKGCCAALALKYSLYNVSDTDFNEYDAAKCAYEFGYRYGYIFDSLIKYYENEGGVSNTYNLSLLRTEREKLHV